MKNKYDFYLDKCLLPVPPEKLQIAMKNGNSTVVLMNEGEINILKTPKLSEIEFECLLPQCEYPFAVYKSGFVGADYFMRYIDKLKADKKPFQFIVSRTALDGRKLFSTNIKVSLESCTVTENGRTNDVKVKIKLKQYRDFSVKTVEIKGGTAAASESRADSPNKPIGIGSEVIVNGRLHGNSYGEAPGQTKTNYRGKINFINLKGSHPYHVTTLEGGWLGWVTKESVKAV